MARTESILVNMLSAWCSCAFRASSIHTLIVVADCAFVYSHVLFVDRKVHRCCVRTIAVAGGGLAPLALPFVDVQK